MKSTNLTTGNIAQLTGRDEWEIRRVVDSLQPPVARFGLARLIPRERLPEIRQALRERRKKAKQLAGV